MRNYENMMEAMVEEVLNIMGDSLHCCMCEQCRSDIAAYALNQIGRAHV